MEVEVVSREIIKPSSPTASHLKTYKISLLDHLYPPTYIPVFIYYHPTIFSTNDMIKHQLPKIKCALSETMTRFYPLMGRLDEDRRHINCNDKGIIFCTTCVRNCTLSELMNKEGKIRTQSDLFPIKPWVPPNEASDYAQIVIQFNLFSCGGVGLGVLFSHKIIDAITIGSFLKCWASISKNGDVATLPNFSAPLLYPSKDSIPIDLFKPFFVKELIIKEGDECTSRKFLFDAKAISILREKATSQDVSRPSRFEAVSCFIWKHAMAASRIATNGQKRPSVFTSHVDMRRKMTPALPKYTVGNILWNACALYDEVDSDKIDLDVLVGLLRAEMNRIKDEFVPKSQGVEGYDAICENLQRQKNISSISNLGAYLCTSWVGVGFYEVDFGWGKVAHVGFAGAVADFKLKNSIYLIEAGCDDETIVAYINLDLNEMTAIENDSEFLAFASPA